MKREKVFAKTNGKCFYCGCNIDISDFHMDHFIAKSNKGGCGNNLVPACEDCNLSKGKLSIEDFRKKISGLCDKNNTARMIDKYYHIHRKPIVFYFERNNING